MAEIKIIKANGTEIHPVTHEDVVVDNNGLSFGFRYQTKTDNFLSTTAKTIVGGINEVNSKKVINEAQNSAAADSVKIRYVKNTGARIYPICQANNVKYTNGETLMTTVNTLTSKNTSATTRTSTAESNITTMTSTNTTSNGKLTTVSTAIGTLSSLQTSAKGNLVAAVNEIKQFGSNLKTRLATALNSKGITNSNLIYTIDELVEIVESDDVGYTYVVESSYTVTSVSGASYGFVQNSNGYWESNNQGKNSTAALCKVTLNNPGAKTVRVYYINNAEPEYDYGMIGNMNVALSTNAAQDASSSLRYSCVNDYVLTEQYITLGNGTSGWFHVKYIKDNSMSEGNDSFQFRIEFL